ncbi:glycosyltransferase family 2 protein [Pedobacter chitinilyticus]|uniref:Glycosyltransferase family 2 protein n=1 Tax=Pedobacter chitinilyticus TaxID=2233776 RepID=A0A3S3SSW2_9SPHI|nr:glycosyltransferase family 2 protein [Pedobacter chitinilyticus]RWU08601.1 glycosyltransferase family 2 protein [Pedobacter chitinilyticus]
MVESEAQIKRKIICLTPIKNEAWILDSFLKAASLWADHIIIADQNSIDNSVEIAKKYPKVKIIHNEEKSYIESSRQKLLISEARKIEGDNNIFIAIDADEFLIDWQESPEWQTIYTLAPGTTIWMDWVNLCPDYESIFYSRGGKALFGYVDDGTEHEGLQIHSYRVPFDNKKPQVRFSAIKNLHLQYAFTNRLKAKHRWYQCLERIKFPKKSRIDIYRQYHHIDLPINDKQPIKKYWLHNNNIFPETINGNQFPWWDDEILFFFERNGIEYFQKIAIWDREWLKLNPNISDPRTIFQKIVHLWLAKSQSNPFSIYNKIINKLLRYINW